MTLQNNICVLLALILQGEETELLTRYVRKTEREREGVWYTEREREVCGIERYE